MNLPRKNLSVQSCNNHNNNNQKTQGDSVVVMSPASEALRPQFQSLTSPGVRTEQCSYMKKKKEEKEKRKKTVVVICQSGSLTIPSN